MVFVLDCNIYISLVINRQIDLIPLLAKKGLTIASCSELTTEIADVLNRPKLKRYLSSSTVNDVLQLLRITTVPFYLSTIPDVLADKKDNYLLALSMESNAHYLVTGDKPLLELKEHQATRIITFTDFRHLISTL
jgi:putative PIN family toxin of toxin-antitoxin system